MEKSGNMPVKLKEEKKEAELPKIEKRKHMHHPVETFSEMSKNANRQAEGAFSTPGEANVHLKIAKNADELRDCQTPIGMRFYQLLRSL
jgi:hypothetical protein